MKNHEDSDEDEEGNTGTRGVSVRALGKKPDPVLAYLLGLKPDAAKDLLVEIAAQFDEVRTELRRRIELAKSDVGALADKAKKAIRDATATACRFYVWGDRDRSIYPDYGEAKQFLERLLELKAYDKLIALADYLTKRAVAQMEMSENDEGQIGYEAEMCMEVIAEAVMLSDMPDVAKISGSTTCTTRTSIVSMRVSREHGGSRSHAPGRHGRKLQTPFQRNSPRRGMSVTGFPSTGDISRPKLKRP